jgi:hypothetical protein
MPSWLRMPNDTGQTAKISGFEIVARALAEAGNPEIAERK